MTMMVTAFILYRHVVNRANNYSNNKQIISGQAQRNGLFFRSPGILNRPIRGNVGEQERLINYEHSTDIIANRYVTFNCNRHRPVDGIIS